MDALTPPLPWRRGLRSAPRILLLWCTIAPLVLSSCDEREAKSTTTAEGSDLPKDACWEMQPSVNSTGSALSHGGDRVLHDTTILAPSPDPEGTWGTVATLSADDASLGWFGYNVQIHGDVAVVVDSNAVPEDGLKHTEGHVHVFTRSAGPDESWSRTQVIAPPEGVEGFGHALAYGGNMLVVSSGGVTSNEEWVVHVYLPSEDEGAVFQKAQILTNPTGVGHTAFGYHLATDEGRILAGTPFQDTHLFEQTSPGHWEHVASFPHGGEPAFAGQEVVVGAPDEGHGAVVVFGFDPGSGGWSERQRISLEDPRYEYFGGQVKATGGRIYTTSATLSERRYPEYEFKVHVYERDEDLGPGWVATATMIPAEHHPQLGLSEMDARGGSLATAVGYNQEEGRGPDRRASVALYMWTDTCE